MTQLTLGTIVNPLLHVHEHLYSTIFPQIWGHTHDPPSDATTQQIQEVDPLHDYPTGHSVHARGDCHVLAGLTHTRAILPNSSRTHNRFSWFKGVNYKLSLKLYKIGKWLTSVLRSCTARWGWAMLGVDASGSAALGVSAPTVTVSPPVAIWLIPQNAHHIRWRGEHVLTCVKRWRPLPCTPTPLLFSAVEHGLWSFTETVLQ